MGRESKKFTKVDNAVFKALRRKEISSSACAMYVLLSHYEFTYSNAEATFDGHPCRWFYMQDKRVAEDMGGVSLNSVSRYREELKGAGLILCKKGIEPPDEYPEYPGDWDRGQSRQNGIPVMWYCLKRWE